MTAIPSAAPVPVPPEAPDVPASRPLWRRVALIAVAVVGLLVTGLVFAALVGAYVDDRKIEGSAGRATAEVLSVDDGKAVVRFTDAAGRVHTPNQGVAYPSGLQTGQLVQVEYAVDDPDQVRVAGRDWTVGIDNAAWALGITWGVALPALWWLRRSGPPLGAPEN